MERTLRGDRGFDASQRLSVKWLAILQLHHCTRVARPAALGQARTDVVDRSAARSSTWHTEGTRRVATPLQYVGGPTYDWTLIPASGR